MTTGDPVAATAAKTDEEMLRLFDPLYGVFANAGSGS